MQRNSFQFEVTLKMSRDYRSDGGEIESTFLSAGNGSTDRVQVEASMSGTELSSVTRSFGPVQPNESVPWSIQ
jgi:hypothetical protein